MATDTATDVLTLLCDVCKQPVTEGQGYICVDDGAAYKFLLEAQEYERRMHGKPLQDRLLTLSDLIDHDQRAPWCIYHRKCDPHPESGDYWLELPGANTYKGLLRWSARLAEKNWFPYTDWGSFVYSLFRMNGD